MSIYSSSAEIVTDTKFVRVSIEALDHPESGARQGVATVTLVWGRCVAPKKPAEEEGREEFTRLSMIDVEDAIEVAREAAMNERKDELRRSLIETAASRALLSAVADRDFWRRASEVAEGLMAEWENGTSPTSKQEIRDAVGRVTVTAKQHEAVMDMIGVILQKKAAEMSREEGAPAS